MGLVGSWYSTWFSTLCQRGFPLAGSAPSPFCRLPFAGAAPFQAPVCGSTSEVGLCGWVGGVFAASLGFLPCAVLFLRACSFPSCRLPWGFPVTGCLSFCFPGDVGWASALPFFFCASPAPLACRSWLGYCTLCQGAPVAVVSAWVEGAVTLLSFPYLRVGVLLAYDVSGVCGLRRWFRLPFVVRHPFPVSVCPSPFLGLGWIGHRFVAPPETPGFWTLLMLGCAVLTP